MNKLKTITTNNETLAQRLFDIWLTMDADYCAVLVTDAMMTEELVDEAASNNMQLIVVETFDKLDETVRNILGQQSDAGIIIPDLMNWAVKLEMPKDSESEETYEVEEVTLDAVQVGEFGNFLKTVSLELYNDEGDRENEVSIFISSQIAEILEDQVHINLYEVE